MNRQLIKAIILLPGTVLVLIPAAILLLTQNTRLPAERRPPSAPYFWLAVLLAAAGIVLSSWTVSLFLRVGKGTPAPWQPPQKLVIRGPYRVVRNPMITSVLLILLAEAVLFSSWPVAIWMGVFFAANAVYFPLVEEKGLLRRFGDDYRLYKTRVPRWIPRLKPWTPPSGGD
jgi:protein-S-isoprenylcysteine O-methyltransferase Ste14